jgi:hypothetical protein
MINNKFESFLKTNSLVLNTKLAFDPVETPLTICIDARDFNLWLTHVKKEFNKGNSTLAVLVNFKAAFDSVWSEKVIKKCPISKSQLTTYDG